MNIMSGIVHVGLSVLSAPVETLGRVLAPARQFKVVHSHGVYGTRRWSYCNAYFGAPGWLLIDVGSWTIEATWRTRPEITRLKFTA